MDAVYGDPVPSFATVELWTVEFKSNHTSLVNDERSGWPKTATTTDNIEKVYQMVRDDRRIRDRKIAEVVIISKNKFAIYWLTIWHEKPNRALDASIAYSGPKAYSNEHFRSTVETV